MIRKQLFTFLFLLLASTAAFAQYWQQAVDYKMNIDFDASKHQFAGEQTLVYYNNSPDTLHKVYYHLYFNAFQPGSMMDVRSRNIEDPDRRVGDRILNLKPDEIGYNQVENLTQNGTALNYKVEGTVLVVQLATPIFPGATATFNMSFKGQVPVQIRRSGRNNAEGIDYTMTQWYPKMAEYDTYGWHPDQYIGREFYGVFGTFDVTIKMDKSYFLAGTGTLQNADEIGEGYFDGKVKKQKGKTRTWHFTAENVHDFAWAADQNFKHTTAQVPNGPLLHFVYSEKTANVENWEKLPEMAVRLFEYMDTTFGKYPYPQFSVIQGGDGGMEYPMCTMIRGNGKSFKGLLGLFAHETIHNWYYGILANNENRNPWMDEGFTSFAESEVMNVLLPDDEGSRINPHVNAYGGYIYLVDSLARLREPMNLGADYFNTNKMYSRTAYTFGELFVNQLRYIVGEEAFWTGIKKYFYTYKFKHPQPQDFVRILEKESNLELDWFPQFWLNTTRNIDYTIAEVTGGPQGSTIKLSNLGTFPMPIDVMIIKANGEQEMHTIPLRSMYGGKEEFVIHAAWPWTNPTYDLKLGFPINEIKAVVIDPYRMMCDVKPGNNSWVAPEKD